MTTNTVKNSSLLYICLKPLSLLVRNGATKNSRARSHVTVTPPSAERKNCGAPNVSRAGTRLVQFCYFWFLFLIFGTILQELSDQEKEYRAEFVQYFVPSSCTLCTLLSWKYIISVQSIYLHVCSNLGTKLLVRTRASLVPYSTHRPSNNVGPPRSTY